jgi:hypothetical protein
MNRDVRLFVSNAFTAQSMLEEKLCLVLSGRHCMLVSQTKLFIFDLIFVEESTTKLKYVAYCPGRPLVVY